MGKFRTKAFRRGFREGLAAPLMIVPNLRFAKAFEIEASVFSAWLKAYETLNAATEKVGQELKNDGDGDTKFGQATRKEKQRDSHAAH